LSTCISLSLEVVELPLDRPQQGQVPARIVALGKPCIERLARGGEGLKRDGRQGASLAFGSLRPGKPELLDAFLSGLGRLGFDDVLGQVEDLRHELGVDALEQHAGSGLLTMGDHHGIDREGGDADDAWHPLHFVHELPVLAEVGGILQDENVGIDTQDLFPELGLKAACDAHDGEQGGDPEGNAEGGEDGAKRDESAPVAGTKVFVGDLKRVSHGCVGLRQAHDRRPSARVGALGALKTLGRRAPAPRCSRLSVRLTAR